MSKELILTIVGAIGGVLSYLFGGLDAALVALLLFMGTDYLTGLIVAGVFKRSGKTENGALSSRAGLKGLCKKGGILLIVLVAAQLDILAGTSFIRDGAIFALCANEVISITENAGLMGIKIPAAITKAIEILNNKADKENADVDS